MATGLKMSLRVWGMTLFCVVSMASFSASADLLPDPTRPAVDFSSAMEGGTSEARPAVGTAPSQGLQSVIISPSREAAIINGTAVERGAKYGDAVLTVVNETCVVLVGPQGRKVMQMFPTVLRNNNEMACAKRDGIQSMDSAVTGVAANKVVTMKKAKTTHKNKRAKEQRGNGSEK
ncbi:MAG: hypothetical protein PXX77_08585 [Gallionella sp.]|nr:hypothetical protein [Gallionella sp.]